MNKPKLPDQVEKVIHNRHMSRRAARASTWWIRRFTIFHRMRRPAKRVLAAGPTGGAE